MSRYQNLVDWMEENKPKKTMSYKEAWWDEIDFLRYYLAGVYEKPVKMYLDNHESGDLILEKTETTLNYLHNKLQVIETHTSKSIKCPVIRLDLKEELGLSAIMRFNFHDWKISIVSEIDIDVSFDNLFDKNKEISDIYCEGFIPELVFGSYEDNKKRFTVEINNKYNVYTFFYLIINYLTEYFNYKNDDEAEWDM